MRFPEVGVEARMSQRDNLATWPEVHDGASLELKRRQFLTCLGLHQSPYTGLVACVFNEETGKACQVDRVHQIGTQLVNGPQVRFDQRKNRQSVAAIVQRA